jgi:hypothetical protein
MFNSFLEDPEYNGSSTNSILIKELVDLYELNDAITKN